MSDRAAKYTWEIDWTHPQNTGSKVWARNPQSPQARGRQWHWVEMGYLRGQGVKNLPVYRKDSWEVDWAKRQGKSVWARNPYTKMPTARAWHWVNFATLKQAGVQWKPKNIKTGRSLNKCGYVVLMKGGMTDAEIALATKGGIFLGAKKQFLLEHRLVALKKYGVLPAGSVIRHLNGIKSDNRPENLVLGTTQENTLDHNTARLMTMYWREKYETLAKSMHLKIERETPLFRLVSNE